MEAQEQHRLPAIGEIIFSLCVLGLSGFIFFDERGISNQTFGVIGPRAFPNVVGIILAVLGCALLFQALTGRWRTAEIGTHRVLPPLLILAGLLLEILFMSSLGFIVASTLLFVCVARAFESKRLLRDVICGIVLTTVTYLIFNDLLLLNLPAGSLWGLN
jgi:putative tricarboxylic transport membrane protein